ncbi:MAG: PfkB family carbohydrate kinase [Actinomycetes bacterium]|jgi:sugar/nucleoside kinase (ribokinase family)|nr:MAG: hypothetical protein DIU67_09600 [Actinomycetota bacterium]
MTDGHQLRVLVTGYASLDRAIRVDRCPGPGATGVVQRVVDARRRPGGVAHAAMALAAGGAAVSVITAVGADEPGRDFVGALSGAGCDTSLVLERGDTSPYTDLLYADDGSTACLFHPGAPGPWELDARHAEAAAGADAVVCMVGPADVTTAVLDAVRDDAVVAWVVKDDRQAIAGGLARRLSGRADLIFCNRDESRLVDREVLRPATVVVQTAGPDPVEVTEGGERSTHPVEPLQRVPVDPTGAGDAFAGGFIAAHLQGASTAGATTAGMAAARRLLLSRDSEGGDR